MEFGGVDKSARSKMGVLTMQEWTIRHHVAGMEFAEADKSARCGKGGHCRTSRSGQCGTIVAGMDNAGVEHRGRYTKIFGWAKSLPHLSPPFLFTFSYPSRFPPSP